MTRFAFLAFFLTAACQTASTAGVEVAHGARLVPDTWHFTTDFEPHPVCSSRCRVVYAIEDTP